MAKCYSKTWQIFQMLKSWTQSSSWDKFEITQKYCLISTRKQLWRISVISMVLTAMHFIYKLADLARCYVNILKPSHFVILGSDQQDVSEQKDYSQSFSTWHPPAPNPLNCFFPTAACITLPTSSPFPPASNPPTSSKPLWTFLTFLLPIYFPEICQSPAHWTSHQTFLAFPILSPVLLPTQRPIMPQVQN